MDPSNVTFGVSSPTALPTTPPTAPLTNPPSYSECVSISILDDGLLEGDHGFSVSLTDVGSFATLGEQLTTTVTIVDDESE